MNALRHRRAHLSVASLALFTLLYAPASSLAAINEDFKPQNEFKLPPWIEIHVFGIDMSINKAVFMLFLASILTVGTVAYVSRKMSLTGRPSWIQASVEIAYDTAHDTITNRNIGNEKIARKYFPFLMTLFLFIWFLNILGFIPMPTNTEHTWNVFGAHLPTFALYAATANIAVPLAFTLIVVVAYHMEGVREHGPYGYVKTWFPEAPGAVNIILKPVEVLSQILRPISLTARLFANMLAGHMIILIMGGGMVVLLGIPYIYPITATLAVFIYFLDVMLVATLQAFIFATLSAIYLGGAVAHDH